MAFDEQDLFIGLLFLCVGWAILTLWGTYLPKKKKHFVWNNCCGTLKQGCKWVWSRPHKIEILTGPVHQTTLGK